MKAFLSVLPESQRLQLVKLPDTTGSNALYSATDFRNADSIKTILELLPVSQRFQAVSMSAGLTEGITLLHHVAYRDNFEAIRLILSSLLESQLFPIVSAQDASGKTILHYAAQYGGLESVEAILDSLPESLRLQLVSMQDQTGSTALHRASTESMRTILDLLPRTQHSKALSIRDHNGRVVSLGNNSNWCDISERRNTALTNRCFIVLFPAVDSCKMEKEELCGTVLLTFLIPNPYRTAPYRHTASAPNCAWMNTILTLYPKSECVRALKMTNCYGDTVLRYLCGEVPFDQVATI